MTLTLVITGRSMKEIAGRLAEAKLTQTRELVTNPDGNTLDYRYHDATYETLAAYHNAQMEETYELAPVAANR